MKKFIISLLCLSFLVFSGEVNAQQHQSQQGVHEPGTGIEDSVNMGQGDQQGVAGENATGSQKGQLDQQQNQGDQNASSVQGQQQGQQGSNNEMGQGSTRRSRVASSVQEMLKVAERNQGIGDQIRNVAQNQLKIHQESEDALEKAQQRQGFMRFFIGPDYDNIEKVEEKLERHNENLEQLKSLKDDVSEEDKSLLENQIQEMEEAGEGIEEDLEEARSGFSLFGWLNRMF